MLEFESPRLSRELPVDSPSGGSALHCPGGSFGLQRLFVGHAPVQALDGEHRQFNLGDVQQTVRGRPWANPPRAPEMGHGGGDG